MRRIEKTVVSGQDRETIRETSSMAEPDYQRFSRRQGCHTHLAGIGVGFLDWLSAK